MSTVEISSLLQFDITKCKPEWEVYEQHAPFHRVYYVYSGKALYESKGINLSLERDCLYIFPVYKEYRISHDPNNPLHCLWFHINLSHTLLDSFFKTGIPNQSPEFYLLKALEKLLDNAGKNIIKNLLNTLLQLMESKQQMQFVSDERLDRVTQFIHANFHSDLNNSTLSRLVNLDTRYFIRLFKKCYGQTPHEYISTYRAFQAASMLMQGVQIKEVARKTGFEDSKSFSRFFKHQQGMTPSEYKESYNLQP